MSARQVTAGSRGRAAACPPPVVIPAHGHGTRMRQLTGGIPKTLLEVAGEPILARLLRASAASGRPAIVYTQELDDAIPAFLADLAATAGTGEQAARTGEQAAGTGRKTGGALPAGRKDPPRIMASLRRREPHGYLTDILAITAELGDEITVLDADMVVPHSELSGFLACTRADTDAAFLAAQTADPASHDPRSIRVTAGPCGAACLAPGSASGLPRLIGAYHWRPPAVRAARDFVAGGPRSFHEFMAHLVGLPLRLDTFTFSSALNVNTPDERALAE